MVVVAVAGGTGNLGRTIVEVLKEQGKFEVVVLSRNVKPSQETELGVRILPADYGSVEALASTRTKDGRLAPELALIKAAEKATTTKRYIPSVWGTRYADEDTVLFPMAKSRVEARHALEQTSLEYTSVYNGFFMDYWGHPHIKSHLQPVAFFIDIPHNIANLPGSGDVPIVFTYSFDVARFVAGLLTLGNWNKDSFVIGDKTTWNNFVKLAEEIKGTKFRVAHDSVELLRQGKITELPSHPSLYPFFPKEALQGMAASLGLVLERGSANFSEEEAIDALFPEIKTMSVRGLLEKAWSGN
ncbi:Isoflavone reductase like P3 [Fusarium albosuccineum]|uniref:Isoflavone reductase like P3 n=1 Tax=Fusarium albosuccineum TaxID=1237068 RepID=A0A8H4L0L7_9HYPO|nr:Isoflavone reductase like P3 [Fusarium albosuccineum]